MTGLKWTERVDDEDGNTFYFWNGVLHNEKGPAIVMANGDSFYYLEGKEVTYAQWVHILKWT